MLCDKKYIGKLIWATAVQWQDEVAEIVELMPFDGSRFSDTYIVKVVKGKRTGQTREWFADACSLYPGQEEPVEVTESVPKKVLLKRKAIW